MPSAFNANSWGTGTCPPDVEVELTNFTFNIPTTPICTTAEMIKPFILMLVSVQAQGYYNNIPTIALQLLNLAGFGDALGILMGAVLARAAFVFSLLQSKVSVMSC